MGFHYLNFAFFFRNLLAYIYIPVLQKELDVFGVLAKIIRACKQENNDYVNSRQITYGIGCIWGMPSLSPLSSLDSGLWHIYAASFFVYNYYLF